MVRETVTQSLTGRKFARYRTFNGKKYEIEWVQKTKKEARDFALFMKRNSGKLTRVVKTKNGYGIYARRK